jgi:hypothetical protein
MLVYSIFVTFIISFNTQNHQMYKVILNNVFCKVFVRFGSLTSKSLNGARIYTTNGRRYKFILEDDSIKLSQEYSN